MPPRASVWHLLRWAADAARIGGACLGLALIASPLTPESVLSLLGIALLLAGGRLWRSATTGTIAVRLAASTTVVVAVRVLGGTGPAAIAAVLVALGGWLQVRFSEVGVGLAIFAGAVAILGGARLTLLVGFWLLGAGLLTTRSLQARLRRRLLGGSALNPERTR